MKFQPRPSSSFSWSPIAPKLFFIKCLLIYVSFSMVFNLQWISLCCVDILLRFQYMLYIYIIYICCLLYKIKMQLWKISISIFVVATVPILKNHKPKIQLLYQNIVNLNTNIILAFENMKGKRRYPARSVFLKLLIRTSQYS